MNVKENLVVVLEDDPGVRGALCLLLEDLAFTPAAGARAAEALAIIGQPFGVTAIITDYDLGAGVNGVDEVMALRSAGLTAPVLVISGSLQGTAGAAARAAGFHFLSKPVRPVDIENWLASRAG